MLTITIRFLRGAYHATPWGHHPNEGHVEWPPTPWRLARALISASFQTLGPESTDFPIIQGLIEQLASHPPVYWLPASTLTHTRHFRPNASYELLDSFLVLDRDQALVFHWKDVDPTSDQLRILDRVLPAMRYLGRSESWVDARREAHWDGVPNCRPAGPNDEAKVSVQMAMTPSEFQVWQEGFLEGATRHATVQTARQGRTAVPKSLWDCLIVDTSRLQKERWSRAPGTRDVPYVIEQSVPGPRESWPRTTTKELPPIARFALAGNPLPSALNSLVVGSTFRRALMNRYPDDQDLPPALTGHDPAGGPLKGHRHAYFLPEDRDRDGRIDHILAYFPEGIAEPIACAMGHLRTLHHRDFEWPVVLEGIGAPSDFKRASSLVGPSRTWVSVTPYLHPWHRKKGGKFSAEEQLRKELALLGRFPAPIKVERLDRVSIAGRPRLSLEFRRSRRQEGSGPDTEGSFWRVIFGEPVSGPIALGAQSHYGLGLFQSEP